MARRDRSGGHHPRVQARVANGRFTKNTVENRFGLSVHVCEGAPGDWCGAFNPTPAGGVPPKTCSRCGRPLPERQ